MYSRSSKIAIGFIPGDLGDLGVLGFGDIKVASAGSSRTWGPNIWTKFCWSGGGMGYWPKLISTNDRPKDHKSLATEYCEPYKEKKNPTHFFHRKMN